MRRGIDPQAEKDAARAAQAAAEAKQAATFNVLAAELIESLKPGWRNAKHADQWANTLETYAGPVLGEMPVADITRDHVVEVLRPIWTDKPETAGRVRGRIEKVLDLAKARGLRTGDNPAAWRGNLDAELPPLAKVRNVEHHRGLPYAEAPAFWRELETRTGAGAAALRFAILTGCRTGEVLGAQWEEIQGETWVIPGERMKAGKEHRVPLTAEALAVIEAQPKARPFIFTQPKGKRAGEKLSDNSMLSLLKRMGYGEHATTHGFRSTLKTWAGETTAHPREVIEHALAHRLKDKAEAAYQRGTLLQKRRQLMTDWAAYVTGSASE
ncbi:Integrase [Pseudohaliea rubra DSM 19751]|uniref:Integrase n=1 Tax=Pseudohaliea rubra DSM 19751 TaxID=1265313 RepID=A0A095VU14_9GAMM|nr:Integrase [Pseudohaliea rubra DSM 19751]